MVAEATPLIVYDKFTNRLIYTARILSGILTTWYVWDLELEAHQGYYKGFIFPTGNGSNYYTNLINDSAGKIVVGYVDGETATKTKLNFYEWDSEDKGHHPRGDSVLWKSKDIDFGSPSVRKKIYKIYVTYKSTGTSGVIMTYGTDGASSQTDTFANSTNYDTGEGIGFKDTAGGDGVGPEWKVAELIPSSSINNIKSIQLAFKVNTFDNEDGAARGGSATTLQLIDHSDASHSNDTYNNYNIYIYDGPGRYNSKRITDYTGSSETVEFSALTDKGYTNQVTSASKYILGSMSPDFEINDITIVFRMKPIK